MSEKRAAPPLLAEVIEGVVEAIGDELSATSSDPEAPRDSWRLQSLRGWSDAQPREVSGRAA